jgi:hypothetical protein
MNNIADDISHAYQDGFNDGVGSVFSKTGFFLVKDEKVYSVDMPYEFKYQKSVDMLTGEVHYPTNRMWLRGMTDEELATFLAHLTDCVWCPCPDPHDQYDTVDGNYKKQWLDWLKEEAEGGEM